MCEKWRSFEYKIIGKDNCWQEFETENVEKELDEIAEDILEFLIYEADGCWRDVLEDDGITPRNDLQIVVRNPGDEDSELLFDVETEVQYRFCTSLGKKPSKQPQ